MTIEIQNIVYDNEKVLFFFKDDVENIQRTASLSWGDLLSLNTVADIKTKLNNIRLKMIIIEEINGKKMIQERVINGLNYNI